MAALFFTTDQFIPQHGRGIIADKPSSSTTPEALRVRRPRRARFYSQPTQPEAARPGSLPDNRDTS